MLGFPLGMIALVVIAALIYFGFAHRVLDRLYLGDSAALGVVAAMAVGSFIDVPLVRGPIDVSLNVGGALIPVALAVYVLARAGSAREWGRALLATGATAGAVFLLNSVLGRGDPWHGGADFLDPLFIYPLVAGGVAYLVGRSRRTAFIAAVLGVLVLDMADWARLAAGRLSGVVAIGGAGAFDVMVLSGLAAVLLAELVGELRERLQGGVAREGRPRALLAGLRPPRFRTVGPARKPEPGGEER
ncbi:MAG: DUF1614 domain-containing protein [Moorellales bacterium]